jgi:hypothetical protein
MTVRCIHSANVLRRDILGRDRAAHRRKRVAESEGRRRADADEAP